ncbi:MAG: mechanosensitive ion channel domain-containing protein [Roseobacter sp.]|jgi:small-conductance mechanosensitive channel|nr:mechanosensitive ion channel domain-containing protein [Roseobacter sp.]
MNFYRITGFIAFLIALVFHASISHAQVASSTEAQSGETVQLSNDVFVAPVIVDGETLFFVRGFSALPATERAANIEQRILEVAQLPDFIELDYEVRRNESGLAVLVNGRMVTVTTEADANYEQISLEVLAQIHAEAIEQAISAFRSGRTNEALIQSAIAAVALTVAFALLTFVFAKYRKRVIGKIETVVLQRFVALEAATNAVVKGNAVSKLVGFVSNMFLWIAYLFVLYYYLTVVLLSFAHTRPFAQLVLTYVSEPLVGVIYGFVGYVPNLITLLIIFFVTRYLIRGLRLFMQNIEAGTIEWQNFEPQWVKPTFNISRVVIIAIAVVFAYPHIPGSDSRAFQGLTILAGLMLSLGSNAVVSNLMAGLFVIYRRSTNIGDRIKVGDQIGDVVEIKMMETLIKSIKNEMISIPNAQLLNSEVINYSRTIDGRGLLVHTTVGIGYEEPQDKVEAMLIEAARRTRDLKKSPAPFVLWAQLADYAINYQINAFTTRGSSLPRILSDLHRNIVDVFNENGVQIMTPSYEADPAEPKIVSELWDGKLAKAND